MTLEKSEHIRNVLIAAALTVIGGVLIASLTWYSTYIVSFTTPPTMAASIAER